MTAHSPEHAIELLDKAFNEADVKSVLSLYDDAAVLIDATATALQPGKEARGKEALRSLYARILKPGAISVEQLKTHVVEADGIALFTSRWRLGVQGAPPQTFIATVVLRRQPDGSWKNLIDSSPSVLGPD